MRKKNYFVYTIPYPKYMINTENVVMDKITAYVLPKDYDCDSLYYSFKNNHFKTIILPVGSKIILENCRKMVEDMEKRFDYHCAYDYIYEKVIKIYHYLSNDIMIFQYVSENGDKYNILISSTDVSKRTIQKNILNTSLIFSKRIFSDEQNTILEIGKNSLLKTGMSDEISEEFLTKISSLLAFIFMNGSNRWLKKNERDLLSLANNAIKYISNCGNPSKMIDMTSFALNRLREQMLYGTDNLYEKIPRYDVRDIFIESYEKKNNIDIAKIEKEQEIRKEAEKYMNLLENRCRGIIRSILG